MSSPSSYFTRRWTKRLADPRLLPPKVYETLKSIALTRGKGSGANRRERLAARRAVGLHEKVHIGGYFDWGRRRRHPKFPNRYYSPLVTVANKLRVNERGRR